MNYIADLHLHSPFSRATSKEMTLDNLSLWARRKGLSLLASSDFTHPDWLAYLKKKLCISHRFGIWSYAGIDYILSVEVSNIFSRDKKTYRIHTLIYSPLFEDAFRIQEYLSGYGNIYADGRPILRLDVADMCEEICRISPMSFVVFAHIWTPWYALFGANSGFDSLSEVFPSGVPENVLGFETGLSSDPPMNWMVGFLDPFTLISSSDAHSPINIGREATVFSAPLSFQEIRQALQTGDKDRILYTVEFFPQEGKYHYDGHRNCSVCMHPEESMRRGQVCPVCGKGLTIGVLNRVYRLATHIYKQEDSSRIGYRYQVPLLDIISFALGKGKTSKSVMSVYMRATESHSEFDILSGNCRLEEIYLPEDVRRIIMAVRNGEVRFSPGYDGLYGKLEISL